MSLPDDILQERGELTRKKKVPVVWPLNGVTLNNAAIIRENIIKKTIAEYHQNGSVDLKGNVQSTYDVNPLESPNMPAISSSALIGEGTILATVPAPTGTCPLVTDAPQLVPDHDFGEAGATDPEVSDQQVNGCNLWVGAFTVWDTATALQCAARTPDGEPASPGIYNFYIFMDGVIVSTQLGDPILTSQFSSQIGYSGAIIDGAPWLFVITGETSDDVSTTDINMRIAVQG